jgi:hypothetical protein
MFLSPSLTPSPILQGIVQLVVVLVWLYALFVLFVLVVLLALPGLLGLLVLFALFAMLKNGTGNRIQRRAAVNINLLEQRLG